MWGRIFQPASSVTGAHTEGKWWNSEEAQLPALNQELIPCRINYKDVTIAYQVYIQCRLTQLYYKLKQTIYKLYKLNID